MERMTIYVAKDGSRWDDERQAVRREALIDACVDIGSMLPPRPELFGNFDGFIQHDPATVAEVKRRLLAIAKREIVGDKTGTWFDEPTHLIHPRGVVGRVISESDGPIYRLWYRLMCMDDESREWDLPYHAIHPGTGVNACIARAATLAEAPETSA